MFGLQDVPRQWPTALRTACCVAVPAVIGWAADDLPSGLLASLGGFTGLYGGARPYLNRARLLLAMAVSLAAVVGLGSWAGADPWLGVLVVTAIAVLATVICLAFSIQPGAYQVALTCATGTALHAQSSDSWRPALLVLAGGLFACLVHLSGMVVDRHGPEREAVSTAAWAVAEYIDAIGQPEADLARHEAAVAMHQTWIRLVNQQPQHRNPGRTLLWLREISRQLQLLLADAMRRQQRDAAAASTARQLGVQARRRHHRDTRYVLAALPLGRPSALSLIGNTVRPRSRSLLVVIRVAVAAGTAGSIGLGLGLLHAYWAIAAAVLVLGQGFDQRRTVQRGLERTVGTALGASLMALILNVDRTGWLLIVTIIVTIFCGQLLVPRNYVLASVFITCSALLMSGAGQPREASLDLLWARGIDTALGCLVAVVVFWLLSNKSSDAWLPATLADAVAAAAAAVDQLTPSAVATRRGLVARRDLQRQVIRLSETYENAVNGFPAQRAAAERVWPAVVAAERLAYRVLAEGWRLQAAGDATCARSHEQQQVGHPPSDGLRVLAEAIRGGTEAGPSSAVPSFLSRDVADLRRAAVLWREAPTAAADERQGRR